MKQGKRIKHAWLLHNFSNSYSTIYKLTGVSKRRLKKALATAKIPVAMLTGKTPRLITFDEFYKLPEK